MSAEICGTTNLCLPLSLKSTNKQFKWYHCFLNPTQFFFSGTRQLSPQKLAQGPQTLEQAGPRNLPALASRIFSCRCSLGSVRLWKQKHFHCHKDLSSGSGPQSRWGTHAHRGQAGLTAQWGFGRAASMTSAQLPSVFPFLQRPQHGLPSHGEAKRDTSTNRITYIVDTKWDERWFIISASDISWVYIIG